MEAASVRTSIIANLKQLFQTVQTLRDSSPSKEPKLWQERQEQARKQLLKKRGAEAKEKLAEAKKKAAGAAALGGIGYPSRESYPQPKEADLTLKLEIKKPTEWEIRSLAEREYRQADVKYAEALAERKQQISDVLKTIDHALTPTVRNWLLTHSRTEGTLLIVDWRKLRDAFNGTDITSFHFPFSLAKTIDALEFIMADLSQEKQLSSERQNVQAEGQKPAETERGRKDRQAIMSYDDILQELTSLINALQILFKDIRGRSEGYTRHYDNVLNLLFKLRGTIQSLEKILDKRNNKAIRRRCNEAKVPIKDLENIVSTPKVDPDTWMQVITCSVRVFDDLDMLSESLAEASQGPSEEETGGQPAAASGIPVPTMPQKTGRQSHTAFLLQIGNTIHALILNNPDRSNQFARQIDALRKLKDRFESALRKAHKAAQDNPKLQDKDSQPGDSYEWVCRDATDIASLNADNIKPGGLVYVPQGVEPTCFWSPELPFDPVTWLRRFYACPRPGECLPHKPKQPENSSQRLVCEYALLGVIHDEALNLPKCDRLVSFDRDIWAGLLWTEVSRFGHGEKRADYNGRKNRIQLALQHVKAGLAPEEQAEIEHKITTIEDTSEEGENVFRKHADRWVVKFGGGEPIYLDAKLKGAQYIAILLRKPNRDFSAIKLVHIANKLPRGVSLEEVSDEEPTYLEDDLPGSLKKNGEDSDAANTIMDDDYRKSCADKINELGAAKQKAEEDNDSARVKELQDEIDQIRSELDSATGFQGKARKFRDPAEKARIAVTQAIGRVLSRIPEENDLWQHFHTSIHTGLFCSYRPDKKIRWRL